MKKLSPLLLLPICLYGKDWTEAHVYNFKNECLNHMPNAALVSLKSVRLENPIDTSDKIDIFYEAVALESIKGEFKESKRMRFFRVSEEIPDISKLEKTIGKKCYIFTEEVAGIVYVDTGNFWLHKDYLEEVVLKYKR